MLNVYYAPGIMLNSVCVSVFIIALHRKYIRSRFGYIKRDPKNDGLSDKKILISL